MFTQQKTLKKTKSKVENTLDAKVAICLAELLTLVPALHKLHLIVTGAGSYAQHTALNEAYDALPDAIDTVAEGYQGAAEVLLKLPSVEIVTFENIEQCLDFCRMKCDSMTKMQEIIPYSEVVNNIDLIKDILNKLKYKLLFLA